MKYCSLEGTFCDMRYGIQIGKKECISSLFYSICCNDCEEKECSHKCDISLDNNGHCSDCFTKEQLKQIITEEIYSDIAEYEEEIRECKSRLKEIEKAFI